MEGWGSLLKKTLRASEQDRKDIAAARKEWKRREPRLELTVALIESAGAKAVFLPAYSPDLNPIEMMWSKVKSILRKLEARDNESLLAAIATALSMVTATDAMGWFSHCGYNII